MLVYGEDRNVFSFSHRGLQQVPEALVAPSAVGNTRSIATIMPSAGRNQLLVAASIA